VPQSTAQAEVAERSNDPAFVTSTPSGCRSTGQRMECPQLASWQMASTDRTPCSRMLPSDMAWIARPSASYARRGLRGGRVICCKRKAAQSERLEYPIRRPLRQPSSAHLKSPECLQERKGGQSLSENPSSCLVGHGDSGCARRGGGGSWAKRSLKKNAPRRGRVEVPGPWGQKPVNRLRTSNVTVL
jgi:hypothetical protein